MSSANQSLRPAWHGKRVHFIGIGGIGMSGAARMLHAAGAKVTGSDLSSNSTTQALDEMGIGVTRSHDPRNVPEACDQVVITAAIGPANPELLAARERGIPVCKYARLLSQLTAAKSCIALSGTHGKTTTTAMVAYLLQEAGADPEVIVGGHVAQIGGSVRMGSGPHFVVEACEYDRSFLELTPHTAVINNIEPEHLDYYRDMDDLTSAFADMASRVQPDGRLVVNADNAAALRAARAARCTVETFGRTEACDWRPTDIRRERRLTRFMVHHGRHAIGEIQLGPAGVHNVCNALAAVAVATSLDVPFPVAQQALARFRGPDRRLQLLGSTGGVAVLDDYAHHPTEIRATLDAVRADFPDRRLWCVFQPHQHSRTRILLPEFAVSFARADRVIVGRIYAVRDSESDRRSIDSRGLVERLCAHGAAAEHIPELDDIAHRLAAEVRPRDVVLTMGAGPVDTVARDLLRRLEQRSDVAAA